MKINEFIEFDKKKIFDGAIQLEWCYNKELRKEVSESYVFHGPKYHGVDKSEVENTNYKLIDTASFVKDINKKLYIENDSNRVMLAIASYGTGKSHLGVTMASLFSEGKGSDLSQNIVKNIEDRDENIGREIRGTLGERNLVLAINGGVEANLNYLILNAARKGIRDLGLDENILDGASEAQNIAKTFIMNNFDRYEEIAIKAAYEKKSIAIKGDALKKYLIDNIDSDSEIFEIINEVYKACTGTYIIKKDTSSAKAILNLLDKELVKKGLVNKILIIVDEFGRYIEFASGSPNAAGDNALQHIIESVQDGNGDILFLGFIQSDIETYMARSEIRKNSNIEKYLGRYKFAQKYYLSSNLETIFANLLKKTDENKRITYIENPIEFGLSYRCKSNHNLFKRWFPKFQNKNVWSDYELYKNIILNGTYPFSPLAIWTLSNLSTWMQERSTIVYLEEAFSKKLDMELDLKAIEEEGLKYINAIDIVSDRFITELKTSEERGLQQSNICIKYSDVIVESGRYLNEEKINVLKAILLSNLFGAKVNEREDLNRLLSILTGYTLDKIILCTNDLEGVHGVIFFNKDMNLYDFIEATNGKMDYFKIKTQKMIRTREVDVANIIANDMEIRNTLKIGDKLETIYNKVENISSLEWGYKTEIYNINNIDEQYINHLKRSCDDVADGLRGVLVYAYGSENNGLIELIANIKKSNISNYPIVFQYIFDADRTLEKEAREYGVLNQFNNSEIERFKTFHTDELKSACRGISRTFSDLRNKREVVTENGVEQLDIKIGEYCETIFRVCYPKVVPFKFDGLESKSIARGKANLETICKKLISGEFVDKQKIADLERELQNRVRFLFANKNTSSWKCMTDDFNITHPNNSKIIEMMNRVNEKLENEEIILGKGIFGEFLKMPYGLNEFSLTTFISLYVFLNRKRIRIYENGERKTLGEVSNNIKSRSKGFKNLLEYKFQLVNEDERETLIERLELVNKTSRVSECLKYREEIKALSHVVDKDENLLLRLENFELKLNRATELDEKISEFKLDITKNIDGIEQKNSTYKKIGTSVVLLEKIKNFEREFSKSREFDISDEDESNIKDLMIKINKVISIDLDEHLKKIQIKSNFDNMELIKKIRILGKKLREYDYISSAIKLENKSINLDKELKEIEKNQKIIDEIKYISNKYESLDKKSIEELMQAETEITGVRGRISDINSLRKTKDQLDQKLIDIRVKISELNQKFKEKLSELDNIKEIKELEKYLLEIQQAKDEVYEESVREKYIDTINSIKYFKKDIVDLEKNNRSELEQIKERLLCENGDKGYFIKIIEVLYKQKIKELNLREINWKENNFIDEYSLIGDAGKLNRRKSELEKYPEYLSEGTIRQIKARMATLTSMLKECEIDGIVELFKELTEEQRRECLEKLKTI